MNRNKAPIHTEDQILNAARTVYQIVKLLKLTRQQYLDMMGSDVFRKVDEDLSQDDFRLLQAFARGVQQTYLTILLTEHCEFVYFNEGVRLTVKEAIQKGPDARVGAVCGHQWLDSEFDFTEFVATEPDPWIS
ncbi:hypothetical protein HOV23_gp121 [Pseudomonas phage Lana]|uniref:Uncharacterized protein n=1 Tax=Pseudomonas phage Lana TaxID=2530172 RepID=A0A481W7P9_9CAUD|nr:hypothetical protein HOV23_gp121 [Pseudomonas phage Lana]QBJ04452.1 hypothetical protein [Pseudomonas phage Lana]